jgi:hypothetical protein
MRNLRPLWAISALLFALSAISCTGKSAVPDTDGPSVPAPVTQSNPSTPPTLSGPDRLAASITLAHTAPFAWASEYDPALPQRGVETYDHIVSFEDPDSAFATYAFRLPAYSGPARIELGGDFNSYPPDEITAGMWRDRPTVWLGLANWQTNRWQWKLLTMGSAVELPSLAPYFRADGTLLLTIYSQSYTALLHWIRIGRSPWVQEPLPGLGLIAYPLLAVAPDGTPWVVGVDSHGLKLLHRDAQQGWTVEVVESTGHWTLNGFEVDATGQVHIIATSDYLISEVPRIRQTDVVHFTPQASPDREVAYSWTDQLTGMENPGSIPRWSWEKLAAPAPSRLAVQAWFDGADLGVFRNGTWEVFDTTVFSPQFAPDGNLRALFADDEDDSPPVSLFFATEQDGTWTTEEVASTTMGNMQDSLLIPHGASWTILGRQDGALKLFEAAGGGGWSIEQLRLPGREKVPNYAEVAAYGADGKLRFSDGRYSYMRTGWGTLADTLIELPGGNTWTEAYDSSGKLHVLATGWPDEIVYSREPEL